MLKHWKRTLALLGVVAATGLVCAAVALGGKKPPTPPPLPPIRYSITFLGTLPGDVTSYAWNVNSLGQVVGTSQRPQAVNCAFRIVPEDTDGDGLPDLWYRDTDGDGINDLMVALNDLIDPNSGWNLLRAKGVNAAGQIVGDSRLNGQVHAYRFTPGVGGAWARVDDLGTLGGAYSCAWAINEQGDVAGEATDANGMSRAFVWTEQGGMVDIGDLGSGAAKAYGINNYRQVTGGSTTPNSPYSRAFRYTPGIGMLDLGDFGANPNIVGFGCGRDINDDGHVVGQAGNAPKVKGIFPRHAFLYTDHLIDLGTLGGAHSEARGINSNGQVVGTAQITGVYSLVAPGDGFLYTQQFGMVKLQDLVVNLPEGFQGPIYADKINDGGQICGYVGEEMVDAEAILLTPVPPQP